MTRWLSFLIGLIERLNNCLVRRIRFHIVQRLAIVSPVTVIASPCKDFVEQHFHHDDAADGNKFGHGDVYRSAQSATRERVCRCRVKSSCELHLRGVARWRADAARRWSSRRAAMTTVMAFSNACFVKDVERLDAAPQHFHDGCAPRDGNRPSSG